MILRFLKMSWARQSPVDSSLKRPVRLLSRNSLWLWGISIFALTAPLELYSLEPNKKCGETDPNAASENKNIPHAIHLGR